MVDVGFWEAQLSLPCKCVAVQGARYNSLSTFAHVKNVARETRSSEGTEWLLRKKKGGGDCATLRIEFYSKDVCQCQRDCGGAKGCVR